MGLNLLAHRMNLRQTLLHPGSAFSLYSTLIRRNRHHSILNPLLSHTNKRTVSSTRDPHPHPTQQLGPPSQDTMTGPIKPVCLIYGEPFSNAFSVKIDRADLVGELKELIVSRNPNDLKAIDPRKLKLYKVEISMANPKKPHLRDEDELIVGDEVGEVFPKDLPKKHVHIIVKVPAVPGATKPPWWEQSITEAFPDGLEYVKPMPLLHTSGLQWDYQPGENLHNNLRDSLRPNYANYRAGKKDKILMPLYVFTAGAGTGKSRHATEFHKTVINCLEEEDDELRKKLEGAWVFHVSLENGFGLEETEEKYPFRAIGMRMLFQLLPEEPRYHVYGKPHPMEVLSLVAKYHKQNLKDATVILVVDGLQNIMTYPNFRQTLTSIGDLTAQGPFILPCCTATVSSLIDETLGASSRPRVYLPVNPLKPPSSKQGLVFKTDPLTKLLVDDCGGHGRALEILAQILLESDIDQCNLGDLMRKIRDRLTNLYQKAMQWTSKEVNALILAVLTHQLLDATACVPNTNKTPEQFASAGLIRFVPSGNNPNPNLIHTTGYLVAPYIWVWVLASLYNVKLLNQSQFDDYDNRLIKIDETQRLQMSTFQEFERFNAFFRSLKSWALREGDLVRISMVHYGAELNGDIEFKNHHLRFQQAACRTNTKSGSKSEHMVKCAKGDFDIREGKHFILNALGAPSGDAFCGLDTSGMPNEVHQYKFYQTTKLTQDIFDKERKKAVSDKDFFLLITTDKNPNVKLSKFSGIVHGGNWNDYFGPFAGRMFFNDDNTFDINTATYTLLQFVVEPEDADKIIKKRPFCDVGHAMQETSIPERLLKRFKF